MIASIYYETTWRINFCQASMVGGKLCAVTTKKRPDHLAEG